MSRLYTPLAALLVCAAAAHALYTYTCKHYTITLWEGSGL